ncbi:MAG: isoprenylcysteine carboxylmethyltransferase family protein [Nanoarchaeota archaeon]
MTIFWILFVIILLFELRILFRNKRSSYDKGSLQLFTIIGYGLIIFIFLLHYLDIGSFNIVFLSYFGLLILLSGFVLRQWSIHVLGSFFIPVVNIQKKQIVINKGPYRHLRHPSYTGLFFELFGLSFVLLNWAGLIAIFALFLPVILYRIKLEEEFLSKNLKGYKEYMKKTWKIIPFVY